MRVLNNQQERSRRERQTTTRPSAHQARTGSLVRRNLKYDKELKNCCQRNVGDVLRVRVKERYISFNRTQDFSHFFDIIFHPFRILQRSDYAQAFEYPALAAIGQLHTSAV